VKPLTGALQQPTATDAAVEIWLYVLELKDGHFYVGQSSNLDMRIKSHEAGKGSAWTTLHPFVRELMRQPTGTNDWKTAEAFENQWTLELMTLRGWQNVRGGWWCNTCPILTRKALIAHGQWEILGIPPAMPASVKPMVLAPEEPQMLPQARPPVVIVRKKRRVLAEIL
jgi:predicted GIY-YIG superfamily endonuclease